MDEVSRSASMSVRTVDRKPTSAKARAKISVTVDPTLLKEVDRHVATHPGTDRSKVVDEALFLWYAREQQRLIEAQFAEPEPPEVREEYEAWRRVRRAAAGRIFGPRDEPCAE